MDAVHFSSRVGSGVVLVLVLVSWRRGVAAVVMFVSGTEKLPPMVIVGGRPITRCALVGSSPSYNKQQSNQNLSIS